MSSGEATEPQSEDSISRYTLPFGKRWQNQLQLGQIYWSQKVWRLGTYYENDL